MQKNISNVNLIILCELVGNIFNFGKYGELHSVLNNFTTPCKMYRSHCNYNY